MMGYLQGQIGRISLELFPNLADDQNWLKYIFLGKYRNTQIPMNPSFHFCFRFLTF